MPANRVFYDQNLMVVAIHPADQVVDPSIYETGKRTISTIIAASEDVPSIMVEERELLTDDQGRPELDADGRQKLGRPLAYHPRRLDQEWIDAHVAPVQETIDGTKGKLALLDADKLTAFTDAIEAISDAKEKMAAKLKFDAPMWTRSDPLWNRLAKAAKMPVKALDDAWRAAVAG